MVCDHLRGSEVGGDLPKVRHGVLDRGMGVVFAVAPPEGPRAAGELDRPENQAMPETCLAMLLPA